LLGDPAFCTAAEDLGEANGHLRRDAALAIDEFRERSARNAESARRLRDRETERLDALPENYVAGMRRIFHRHSSASLQKLAGGEVADEAAVGGEEVVGGEVFKADPADLLVDLVIDFSGELVDDEELQIDGAAVAIVMADVGDGGADGSLDAKLFRELTGQGLLGALAGFDFAAGKLP